MEILARSLASRIDSVALVHPTFDNIADILRGVGLGLVPVAEDPLHAADLDDALLRRVGCVFVTTPNNPTGRVVEPQRLRRLAEQCAEHDVVLALDTSFRGFDTRAHYDHYAILTASGCRWVVIEDTGKLWPTLDLKVGLLVSAGNLGVPIDKIYSDILLGVSPMILAMVRRFAEDAADGGLADLHAFIAANRAILRSGLADVPGIHFPDPHSRVSVERVHVGQRTGSDVWAALKEQNVYALPCRPFHWADHAAGDHTLRIALARSASPLTRSVEALRSVLLGR
jgi:enduracididine biosynthesis enzyme MppP